MKCWNNDGNSKGRVVLLWTGQGALVKVLNKTTLDFGDTSRAAQTPFKKLKKKKAQLKKMKPKIVLLCSLKNSWKMGGCRVLGQASGGWQRGLGIPATSTAAGFGTKARQKK